eukprot:63076_1
MAYLKSNHNQSESKASLRDLNAPERRANDGLFTWRWNGPKLSKLLCKQRTACSDLFKIGGCEWRLVLEIDDAKLSQPEPYEIFNLYLEIPFKHNTNLSDISITTNIRLYHYETGVSWTDIIKFGSWQEHTYANATKHSNPNKTRESIGWSNHMLRLDEAQRFETITIGCYIKILQIQNEMHKHSQLLYQCPVRMKRPLTRSTANSKLGYVLLMKWTLSNKERQAVRNARCGQSFESQIQHEMFCFRLFPNGINPQSRGQVILCVSLCLLPPSISKVTVRVRLKCEETGTLCLIYRNGIDKLKYSYDSTYYHWPEYEDRAQYANSKPLFFEEFIQQKRITFTAQLEVIKHYDLNGNAIKHEHDWKKRYPKQSIPKQPAPISPPRPRPKQLETLQNATTMPVELIWNITNISNEYYNDSTVCLIQGLKWFLRWRYNTHRKTCVILLCLREVPQDMEYVSVNYRVLCSASRVTHTDIATFSKQHWSHGICIGDIEWLKCFWFDGSITIRCYMNMIKIVHVHNAILYETSMKLFNPRRLYRYEWLIDEALLNTILQSNEIGQKYESNIYQNIWCLSCYPNGIDQNSKGKTVLGVQICMFPQHITKIKAKLELSCPQLNKVWSTLVDFDVHHKTYKTWNLATLSKFELNGLDHVVFVVQIVIIQQYTQGDHGDYIPYKPLFKNKLELDRYFTNVMHFENNILNYAIHADFQSHTNEHVGNVICSLIKKYYPLHTWTWDITDQNLLSRLVVGNNMDKYESNLFEIDGLRWYLKLYPNGYNRKTHGYVQLFVTLACLPLHVKNVLAIIRLSCHQTLTSYTFFADISKKHKTWGWHRNFSVHELHSLFLLNQCNRLTFECEIKVLNITAEVKNRKWHTGITYAYNTPSIQINNANILHNRYEHSWQIDRSLMEMFRKSENGKMYESKIFHDMFCLQIYPNGFKKQAVGNVQVFCQICAFPQDISAILVKLELLCVDNQAKWQHIVKFDMDYNNWGWTDGTITTNELYDYDELTFKARIQFIELYDENGNEMSEMPWIEDTYHDEKTPHECDDSHYELEVQTTKVVTGFVRSNQSMLLVFDNIIGLITKFSMLIMDQLFASSNLSKSQSMSFNMNPSNARYISEVFELYNLKWVLESYVATEHTYRTQHKFYHMMVTLCSMPSAVSHIVISYRIYCPQTMSSTTSLCILPDTSSKNELSSGPLLMKSNDHEPMTFNCSIQILRIKDERNEILYEYPFNGGSEGQTYSFQWKIGSQMISKFAHSFKGQKYESEDIYYELFCVGIAPNGLHEKGYKPNGVILYLQLCCMPTGLSSITVRCEMECIELKIKTQSTEQNMGTNNDKFSKIQYRISRTQEFYKRIEQYDIKKLTINCKVNIIGTHYEVRNKLTSMRTARPSQDMDLLST